MVSWVAGERERREGEGKRMKKIGENRGRRGIERAEREGGEERSGGKEQGEEEGRKVFTSVFLQSIPKWSVILMPMESTQYVMSI